LSHVTLCTVAKWYVVGITDDTAGESFDKFLQAVNSNHVAVPGSIM